VISEILYWPTMQPCAQQNFRVTPAMEAGVADHVWGLSVAVFRCTPSPRSSIASGSFFHRSVARESPPRRSEYLPNRRYCRTSGRRAVW
jgi:hypothetical protein